MRRIYLLFSCITAFTAASAQTADTTISKTYTLKFNSVTEELQKQVDSLMDLLGGDFKENFAFSEWEKAKELSAEQANKPFLGIVFESNEDAGTEGVVVMRVVEGSSAETAGLKAGDVITALGGKKVTGMDDIVSMIKERKVGDELDIVYMREGVENSAIATLQARQEKDVYSRIFEKNLLPPSPPEIDMDTKRPLFGFAQESKPRLGVQISDLDAEMAKDLKVKNKKGVLVIQVDEHSAADKMGLKVNDVITKVNDRDISNVNDLMAYMQEAKLGDALSVSYNRYGKKKTTHGELTACNTGWQPNDKFKIFKFEDHATFPPGQQDLREELEDLKLRLQTLEEELKEKGE